MTLTLEITLGDELNLLGDIINNLEDLRPLDVTSTAENRCGQCLESERIQIGLLPGNRTRPFRSRREVS